MKDCELDSLAVFGANNGLVVASVAIALVGSAFREALFAEFIAKVKRAGNHTESDAGPHERQKWAPDAEIHVSFILLHRLRAERLHDFESSCAYRGHYL